MTTQKPKAKQNKRVYFDMIINRNTNSENIALNVGSRYINKDELEDIDTGHICKYIIAHKTDFFKDKKMNICIINVTSVLYNTGIEFFLDTERYYITISNIHVI